MSSKRIIVFILLLLVMGFCVSEVLQIRATHQYMIPFPAMKADEEISDEASESDARQEKEEKKVKTLLEKALEDLEKLKEENADLIQSYFVEGLGQKVSVSEERENQTITGLKALYGNVFPMEKMLIHTGRFFYPEELLSKRKVAIIDEQLALELYRKGDPLGSIIKLGLSEYEIIGIAKHARRAGDVNKHYVYVPLLSLQEAAVNPELLNANISIKSGSGGGVALKKLMESWRQGGTYIGLPKEKIRTMLSIRFLLCLIAITLISLALRFYKYLVKLRISKEKEKLEKIYAKKLLLRWILIALGYLLALLGILFGLYVVMDEILKPVYIFPEWVPSVIVEVRSLIETFYNNREISNALIEFRSEQLLYLRFLRSVLSASSILLAYLLLRPYETIRRRLYSLIKRE